MQAKTSSFTTPRYASHEVPSAESSPYVEEPPAVLSDHLETFNPVLLTSRSSSSSDSAEITEKQTE
ncbi:hypothetical protein BFJ71_g17667 [Fusarium oxysporum]|nr:hypothetical protein BFJ71_g17667 [Fusarium oxysporum]